MSLSWQESGMLVGITRHGENAALLDTFTHGHGLSRGVLPGATSRRNAAILQVGNQLSLRWRARLAQHLGNLTVELEQSRVAVLIAGQLKLAALLAICRLLLVFLPERHPYPRLYLETMQLMDDLADDPEWPVSYLKWEMTLLRETGYELNLAQCAVTGSRRDLAFVSPTSGRSVSRNGAGKWAPKLLPLPPCMLGMPPRHDSEIVEGLGTTGFFLEKYLRQMSGRQVDIADRSRFVEKARQLASQNRLRV